MTYQQEKIECPCCKGTGILIVHFDRVPDAENPPQKTMCCHCMGAGFVYNDNRSNNRYE